MAYTAAQQIKMTSKYLPPPQDNWVKVKASELQALRAQAHKSERLSILLAAWQATAMKLEEEVKELRKK